MNSSAPHFLHALSEKNNASPDYNRTRVKFCGFTRAEDIHAAVKCGVDAIGFVLYPASPRAVSSEQAAQLASLLPPFVTPVLLFVNATAIEIEQALKLMPQALLQFHGDESPADCSQLSQRRPFIRAAHIPTEQSIKNTQIHFNLVEYAHRFQHAQAILLDAQNKAYGGGGQTFPWSLLPTNVNAHLVLSGGLTPENVSDGIQQLRHCGFSLSVDVSSGIELIDKTGKTHKGIKDSTKMQHFMHSVRQADELYKMTNS